MLTTIRLVTVVLSGLLSAACGQAASFETGSAMVPSADAGDNQVSSAEQSAAWQLLFDGVSLAQWRTYGEAQVDERWQIENGVLMLTEGGGGDLITRGQWSDFELMLDWNIAQGGNSGVFFLADESLLPIFVHAPEIQLLDNERAPDRKKPNHRSGSLYDMITAPPESQRPAGQWNTLRILLQNQHLQVWQNDVQTVEITIGSERWQALVADSKFGDWMGFAENPSGHIGLQDHGDQVAFKNLKIRDLSE